MAIRRARPANNSTGHAHLTSSEINGRRIRLHSVASAKLRPGFDHRPSVLRPLAIFSASSRWIDEARIAIDENNSGQVANSKENIRAE
jgi:hypothetical protein